MKNPEIAKIQRKNGTSYEQIVFFMKFLAGAANLYGIIRIDDLYDVYQNIKLQNADYQEISFEQFIGLISIADKVGKQFIVINPHIFNDYVIHSGEKLKHPLLVQEPANHGSSGQR